MSKLTLLAKKELYATILSDIQLSNALGSCTGTKLSVGVIHSNY